MSTGAIGWFGISTAAWLVVFAPLLVALVSVIIGYFIAKKTASRPIRLYHRMGTGSWKFSESWASTLTASGAIFGLVLAAQILPQESETEKLTRNIYVMLNLMFGVIVVLAALSYNAIRRPVQVPVNKGQSVTVMENQPQPTVDKVQTTTVTENQGYVGIFLVACVLVLWAVLGQLITTYFLLGEIRDLPLYIHTTFIVFIALSVLGAIVYGVASVSWTLHTQQLREDLAQEKEFILP